MPSADVVLPTNLLLPPWSEIDILADACIPEGFQSITMVYLVKSKAQDKYYDCTRTGETKIVRASKSLAFAYDQPILGKSIALQGNETSHNRANM